MHQPPTLDCRLRTVTSSALRGLTTLLTAAAALASAALALAPAPALAGTRITPAAGGSAFTPGDVVVYRVGTSGDSLGSGATPVFLDEYGPSGGSSPALTLSLPTASAGAANALTASGSASSEGLLTLSPNAQYLALTGYDAAVGSITKSLSSTPSTTTPRTVGIVDEAGDIDTSTALTDFANANNPRSAVTEDGQEVWVGGAAGGIRYATDGATTSTPLNDADTNVRGVSIVDGQLYTSADSTKTGAVTIATVGSGTPTSDGQTISNLPFSSSPPSEPYGYALLTLGTGNGADTLYVADQTTGAVLKYGLSGGSWVPEGSVSLSGADGLAANDVDGTVTIYVTTNGGGTTGSLYELTDSSGQAGTLSGTPQLIATAPSGEAFRGVAFAPGTTIGSGPGTPPVTPSITPDDTSLAASLTNATSPPVNPTLGLTVSDPDYDAGRLQVSATSSDPSVAADVSVSGSGAERTLTVTPGTSVGYSTVTVTVTAPDQTTAETSITYGLSADDGDSSDRYYSGAGNASTEISVGDGYFIAGDDLSNVLRLYDSSMSGAPVNTFDFTGELPDGATSIDIEAAARVGDVIYWLGSQSNSDSGNPRPAADTLFATQITGSGADTTLSYLGSYTGLRDDLINWDETNGNPLGLQSAGSNPSKQATGLNVEGVEFAPGSTTTAYVAFRAPLEPYGSGNDALLVPVTDLPSLIGAQDGSATFGSPIEMNLGGLGIREIRKNADDQYLIIAGTPDGSNSQFSLYTWDGEPADSPTLTDTALPQTEDGAWEGIVSVPDPLVDGSSAELVEDNGDTAWYGDASTSKSGLPSGLQKDLGETFTVSLPSQTVNFTSTPPDPAGVGTTYAVSAASSAGLAVMITVDSTSTAGTCSLSGSTLSFQAPGTCILDANQSGSISAAPAQQAQQTITVQTLGNTSPPTVTGTAQDGAKLTGTNGTWSVPSSQLTFKHQWELCPSAAETGCTPIKGATGLSYTATSADVGSDIVLVVTATDKKAGETVSASSTPTGEIAAPGQPANTTLPTIKGTFAAGKTLTATNGKWTSPDKLTYTRAWESCDATGANCSAIPGATHTTLKLTKAEVAEGTVEVLVTATDAEGQSTSATSAAYPAGGPETGRR
jgi:hypothetical protein